MSAQMREADRIMTEELGIGVMIPEADLLIDALVGYSLRGAPRGRVAQLIASADVDVVPRLSDEMRRRAALVVAAQVLAACAISNPQTPATTARPLPTAAAAPPTATPAASVQQGGPPASTEVLRRIHVSYTVSYQVADETHDGAPRVRYTIVETFKAPQYRVDSTCPDCATRFVSYLFGPAGNYACFGNTDSDGSCRALEGPGAVNQDIFTMAQDTSRWTAADPRTILGNATQCGTFDLPKFLDSPSAATGLTSMAIALGVSGSRTTRCWNTAGVPLSLVSAAGLTARTWTATSVRGIVTDSEFRLPYALAP